MPPYCIPCEKDVLPNTGVIQLQSLTGDVHVYLDLEFRGGPKFSDRKVWRNREDPGQTATER